MIDTTILAVALFVLAALGFGGTIATGAALAFGLKGMQKDLAMVAFLGASHTLLGALIGGLWLIP